VLVGMMDGVWDGNLDGSNEGEDDGVELCGGIDGRDVGWVTG
jgi:hypothetical protein